MKNSRISQILQQLQAQTLNQKMKEFDSVTVFRVRKEISIDQKPYVEANVKAARKILIHLRSSISFTTLEEL